VLSLANQCLRPVLTAPSWREMPACRLRRAGIASNLRSQRITLGQSQNCDLPGKQKGLVDRLRHLTAQTFASDVVGAEMLPGVNPAQSRLLRRR
jgi:hypothetical protein